jgi:hypothetical protein
LRPVLPKTGKDPGSSISNGTGESETPYLDTVDDDSEEDINTTQPGLGETRAKELETSAQYGLEPEHNEDEGHFCVWCLFKDLNRILEFVYQTWTVLERKEIDLASASVTINAAIDIVRSLEEGLSAISSKGCEEIIRIYYEGCCASVGLDPYAKEFPNAPFNIAAFHEVERSCLSTYVVLSTGYMRSREIVPRKGYYEKRTNMIPRQLFSDDEAFLLEHLRLMWDIEEYGYIEPADEFTRASMEFLQNQKMSLWFVFAAKCYPAGIHVRREGIWEGVGVLIHAGWVIGNSVRQYLKDHQFVRHPLCAKDFDEQLEKQILQLIDSWTLPAKDESLPVCRHCWKYDILLQCFAYCIAGMD